MHSVAVMLHLVKWKVEGSDRIELSEGIHVCRSAGTPVYALYEVLAKRDHPEQDKPFDWATHIEAHLEDTKWLYDLGGHRSVASRLCNLVTISLGKPVGHATFLASSNSFATLEYSDRPHAHTLLQSDLIYEQQPSHLIMNGARADELKQMWQSELGLRKGDGNSEGNVAGSLDYFLYSWRAYYREQACINLCIAMEQLFSPSGNTELTHRIAFNASRFLGTDAESRRGVYDDVRSFYGIRSRIVHGDKMNAKAAALLESLMPKVFRLCAAALKRILMDETLIRQFSSKDGRLELFNSWLFE